MPTIAQTIASLQSAGLDLTDSRLLLLHAIGQARAGRAWLLAHDTDLVGEAASLRIQELAGRRLAGEPVAYIVGTREFFGLSLRVTPDVLIPRPDTETLVDWALDALAPTPGARVVDLGTGSGAIALALKATRPALQVEAVDYSHAALAVAQGNAQQLGLDIRFSHGSWLSGPSGLFQVIVSNPPYIREDDEHLPALAYEPRTALTAGNDGFSDLRAIIDQARTRLLPSGWLLLEHGYDQASEVRALLSDAGFGTVQSRRDLAGIERCSGGQWHPEI
ncbi:peptide chain release factor N(5)-glutamine methyltransferase [Rhodoferax sp.]|uniref:peptide chain release factor N(5)-glutamine methyltransferase n=1 Tax=Rhodoferax sp. TaxID=50421 RepID=UPI0025E1E16F|nr:peptide chain release factor N(5)-glutamine methyltransferase [Rhodoferax sp.]